MRPRRLDRFRRLGHLRRRRILAPAAGVTEDEVLVLDVEPRDGPDRESTEPG